MPPFNSDRNIAPRPEWSFGEVVEHAWQMYTGGGIESTGRRNVLYRFWAAMVGAQRAVAELDYYVDSHGGAAPAADAIGCSPTTLKRLRKQFQLVDEAPLSPVPIVLASGEELRGRRKYVVDRRLGSGGMGVVYSAIESGTKTRFAAKVLSSSRFLITNVVRDRFVRESALATEFESEHVVKSVECLHHRGTLVSIMEHLPGRTVYDALNSEAAFGTDERLRWIRDMTAGLAYLHAREIVHRDISRRNAMFRPSGAVALSDFGVARRTDDDTLTTSDERMGSLLYISPDQRANPHLAGFRDDVYSLGQVAFHVLSGTPPHGATLVLEEMGYSVALSDWVRALRSPNPIERPATAVEALELLERLSQGE